MKREYLISLAKYSEIHGFLNFSTSTCHNYGIVQVGFALFIDIVFFSYQDS